ncbi:MAG: oxygenase MpaB family protein [Actinomycetota bacterium]
MTALRRVIDAARDRVVATTTGLFSHGPVPLEHTLEHVDDPGLLGPDSVSWRVIGDAAAFVGGIRALLVQTAHPEVAAGVADHSTYREDPLGRLSRTSVYVTETTYGARAEVDAAVAVVRRVHAPVRGASPRGRPYAASTPELAAWVHNSLTDSFLTAYRHFGATPLSDDDADRFVVEQRGIGELLGAAPLPSTAEELSAWLRDHPDLAGSPGQLEAVDFLRRPPLPWPVLVPYRLMFAAAAATVPERLREIIGIEERPGAERVGQLMIRFLRWALGSSPSWHLALVRAGAPIPDGRFRQPLPPAARELLRRRSG